MRALWIAAVPYTGTSASNAFPASNHHTTRHHHMLEQTLSKPISKLALPSDAR